MNNGGKRLTILETNIFYLAIALIFLGLGPIVQGKNIYTGLIITEFLIILLPTILYLKARKYNIRSILRLNRLSFKQAFLIPLITIFIYPVAMFINSIVLIILSFFGEVKPIPIPVPETGGDFLISFAVFSLSAGICEEVMFRGMIMKAYERVGTRKAILISTLLFGIFHFNIQNLAGPIFLGLVFGYIVYKTDSIYSSMLAHITNNTIATVLYFFSSNLVSKIDTQQSIELAKDFSYPLIMTFSSLMLGVVSIIPGIIAFFLIKALPYSENSMLKKTETNNYIHDEDKLNIFRIIPLVVVVIIFIYLTVQYIINM